MIPRSEESSVATLGGSSSRDGPSTGAIAWPFFDCCVEASPVWRWKIFSAISSFFPTAGVTGEHFWEAFLPPILPTYSLVVEHVAMRPLCDLVLCVVLGNRCSF